MARKSKLDAVYQGWAVLSARPDIDGSVHPSLRGIGAFGWERPDHHGAIRTAVFETRKKARDAIKAKRETGWADYWSHVTPVRVSITVRVTP